MKVIKPSATYAMCALALSLSAISANAKDIADHPKNLRVKTLLVAYRDLGDSDQVHRQHASAAYTNNQTHQLPTGTGISGIGYLDDGSGIGLWAGGSTPVMTFTPDQNIAIGTSNAQGYRLAVNGNALFTKVKVKLFNNWPDYVFEPSYHLPPLKELEGYVSTYHHLPGVPSAEDIGKKDLDLAENQVLLLKKVEELTLYVIQANKEIEELKTQNQKLVEQNNVLADLQKQIAELKSQIKQN